MLWQGAEYGSGKKNLKSISTPPLPSKKRKMENNKNKEKEQKKVRKWRKKLKGGVFRCTEYGVFRFVFRVLDRY